MEKINYICRCGCGRTATWKVSGVDYNPNTKQCDIPFVEYCCDGARSYLRSSHFEFGIGSKYKEERLVNG